jgi:hypothetical protein
MRSNNRRRLLLRVSGIVAVVVCCKLAVHFLGWEILSINPLFSGIVAANVFLMIYLLLLIRDLDNPFGYYDRHSGEDVSLKPLEDTVRRLEPMAHAEAGSKT